MYGTLASGERHRVALPTLRPAPPPTCGAANKAAAAERATEGVTAGEGDAADGIAGDPAAAMANESALQEPSDFEDGDAAVGTLLEDGWWVKARMEARAESAVESRLPTGLGTRAAVVGAVESAGPRYLCCRGAGRKVEYCYRSNLEGRVL